MTAENKLEDSELLKQKMQEGYQCVLQGRSVYQLKSNSKENELGTDINNSLYAATIIGYL